MSEPKAHTIEIGEIENASELCFVRSPNYAKDNRRYLLHAPGRNEDYTLTLQRYRAYDVTRTIHHYIEDTSGQWFACYNVDCFDPPFAIIRARSFENAYEVFCDEFSDWLKVEEPDAADYPEEERDYSASGVHIDTSNVQIHPITLLSVECLTLVQTGQE